MADRIRLTGRQVAGLRIIMERHADEEGWFTEEVAINHAGLFESAGLKATVYIPDDWPGAGRPEVRYELDGEWPDYVPREIPLSRRERFRRWVWDRRH